MLVLNVNIEKNLIPRNLTSLFAKYELLVEGTLDSFKPQKKSKKKGKKKVNSWLYFYPHVGIF